MEMNVRYHVILLSLVLRFYLLVLILRNPTKQQAIVLSCESNKATMTKQIQTTQTPGATSEVLKNPPNAIGKEAIQVPARTEQNPVNSGISKLTAGPSSDNGVEVESPMVDDHLDKKKEAEVLNTANQQTFLTLPNQTQECQRRPSMER